MNRLHIILNSDVEKNVFLYKKYETEILFLSYLVGFFPKKEITPREKSHNEGIS